MLHKSLETTVKDLDQKGRVIVAANAFGNEDSDGDISLSGSFKKTIAENFSRVKWLYNHDRTILLGVPIEAKEDGTFLKIEGQLNLKKEISRDVYEDYKLYADHGKTLEHSIGVNPIKWENMDGGRREVSEWKLWEYSTLSSWGANENTPMLGIKGLNTIQEGMAWLGVMIKKGDYTDERFEQIEKLYKELSSLIEPETASNPLPAQAAGDVSKSTTRSEPDDDGNGDELMLALRLLTMKI